MPKRSKTRSRTSSSRRKVRKVQRTSAGETHEEVPDYVHADEVSSKAHEEASGDADAEEITSNSSTRRTRSCPEETDPETNVEQTNMPKQSKTRSRTSSSRWKMRKVQRTSAGETHEEVPDDVLTDEVSSKAHEEASDDVEAEEITSNSSSQTRSYPEEIDPETNVEQVKKKIEITALPPTRDNWGDLIFEDFPEFRPNLPPKEVLLHGSFGGTYFRPIKSGVTGKRYSDAWKELPKDWLKFFDVPTELSSSVYDKDLNKYKCECGESLNTWEARGWIHKQDPYGWFQWYCRFYRGRRTADDERQIGQWLRFAGPNGLWRKRLMADIVERYGNYDMHKIDPVARQNLQHWGYVLTHRDFEAYKEKMKDRNST